MFSPGSTVDWSRPVHTAVQPVQTATQPSTNNAPHPYSTGSHSQWSLPTVTPPMHFMQPAAPRLAPISIPYFNGEWRQWTTFISLFESLIDANPCLAPVQKLQYLLNYVQGEARDCIAHVVISNDNYQIALDILRRRFHNERKLCDDYVSKILDLPKVEQRSAAGILHISTVLTTSLHGLNKCNFNTESWGPIVVNCVVRKLDEESRQKFEESLQDSRQVPTINQLQAFLDRRYQVLLTDTNIKPRSTGTKTVAAVARPVSAPPQKQAIKKCCLCNKNHSIRQCETFLGLTVSDRLQRARSYKLCLNCLGGHAGSCNSRFTCQQCKGKHHTLLHLEQPKHKEHSSKPSNQSDPSVTLLANREKQVLLATALVKVRNIFGQHETLRALIDPGSQENFITVGAVQSLSLRKNKTSARVSGIGETSPGKIISQVELQLEAHFPSEQCFATTALVMPKLTANLPSAPFSSNVIPALPPNIMLADPTFNVPGPIDILLGAGMYAEIIKNGTRKFNSNQLLLQNTELGWMLTGQITEPVRQIQSLLNETMKQVVM